MSHSSHSVHAVMRQRLHRFTLGAMTRRTRLVRHTWLMSAALGLTACASGRVEPVAPSADSTSTAPVTASSSLPPSDAVAGLHTLQVRIVECLRDPAHCDVDSLAVPGSPAFHSLDGLRRYYVVNGLVAHVVPEYTYVVPERVRMIAPGRAEVVLCEVDGSWQMDSRRTQRTDDDIIWNDSLISRRARHLIVADGDRWRRERVDEIEFWPGENRCTAAVPA